MTILIAAACICIIGTTAYFAIPLAIGVIGEYQAYRERAKLAEFISKRESERAPCFASMRAYFRDYTKEEDKKRIAVCRASGLVAEN